MSEPLITLEFLQKRPISFSSLKEFLRSPMHFKYFMTTPARSKKLPPAVATALAMGKLIDYLILTPEKFDEKFAVHSFNIYSYADKPKFEIFCEMNKGKMLVTKDDYEKALMIKASVLANTEARKILDKVTQTQREYRWTDEETGLPCIAYTDAECDNVITAELKSTQNASPKSFEKDAYNFLYPFQTGFYKEAQMMCNRVSKNYKYIVVEKEAPWGVAVYTPSDDYIEAGRKMFRETIRDFKVCLDNQQFDCGYEYLAGSSGSLILDLPPWAKKRY